MFWTCPVVRQFDCALPTVNVINVLDLSNRPPVCLCITDCECDQCSRPVQSSASLIVLYGL